jgi:hypothetical protein
MRLTRLSRRKALILFESIKNCGSASFRGTHLEISRSSGAVQTQGRGAFAATNFILNKSEFNVALMSNRISPGALLFMVIVNDEASVNYTGYPAE